MSHKIEIYRENFDWQYIIQNNVYANFSSPQEALQAAIDWINDVGLKPEKCDFRLSKYKPVQSKLIPQNGLSKVLLKKSYISETQYQESLNNKVIEKLQRVYGKDDRITKIFMWILIISTILIIVFISVSFLLN